MSDRPDPEAVRSNKELTAATGAGLRWMTFARLGAELLMLGSMVVLARLIPPAAFGTFAVVVIVQELAYSMPMEGIGSALVQRREIDREHLQGGLVLSLLVGIALSLLTLAAAVWIVLPVFGQATERLIILATPWFLIGAVYAVPVAVLRRRLDFRRLSVLDFSQTLVRILATIPLAVMGLDATALVLGNMVGIVTGLVLALCFVRIPLPRWRPRAMRDLLGYGGPAALACVAWTGFRNGDYAIIGARLGAAQAGFYWRGYQLAVEYQRKISTVMAQMAFPVLARTTGLDALHELRRRMVQLLTVALFPLLVLLVVLAPEVVPWLFGPDWEPAVLPAQLLALGGAATLVIDAVGSVLMATGRSRSLLGYGVAHFAVYIGAVLVVASHGLAAVAIAASAVHALFLVVAYQVLFPGEGRSALALLWSDVAAAFVSCLALAAVAVPLELALRAAGAPVPVHLLLVAPAGLLAYAAVLRIGYRTAWQDLVRALGRVVPLHRLTRGHRDVAPTRPSPPITRIDMDRRIDVVVVSYNSRDTLRECVAPLAGIDDLTVTVVDNASPDDSLDVIADLDVRAIQSGRNAGFGTGCNLGMAAGDAPFVLFLNPDAQVDPADLQRMLDVLEAEPDVAVVGPRLLDDAGEIIPSLRRYQRARTLWAQAFFVHRLLPRAAWANEIDTTPAAYDRVAYPEWISGAAMLGRREALEAVNGFDEGFFLYCEDMDLCARLVAAGHRIRYEPGATVRHRGGHSAPRSSLLAVLALSRVRYSRRHAGAVVAAAQRAAIAVDALTHSVAAMGRPSQARGQLAALAATVRRDHGGRAGAPRELSQEPA